MSSCDESPTKNKTFIFFKKLTFIFCVWLLETPLLSCCFREYLVFDKMPSYIQAFLVSIFDLSAINLWQRRGNILYYNSREYVEP